MSTLTRIRSLSVRRKIASLALVTALVGTGFASFAAVTDQLVHTNNFALLFMDLKGSTDGTTDTDSTTLSWQIDSTANAKTVKALRLTNSGNGSATVTFALSGPTVPGNLNSGSFKIYEVASQAACTTTVSGTPRYDGAAGINGGSGSLSAPLAISGTQWLCFLYTNPSTTLNFSGVYAQTITFTATSV